MYVRIPDDWGAIVWEGIARVVGQDAGMIYVLPWVSRTRRPRLDPTRLP